jgi:hypothetical protein
MLVSHGSMDESEEEGVHDGGTQQTSKVDEGAVCGWGKPYFESCRAKEVCMEEART